MDNITCKIPLSGKKGAGLFALVDEQDYVFLSGFRWYDLGGYAARNAIPQPGSSVLMHKAILPCVVPLQVDHINGDKLDNRRANLRLVTFQQNMLNCKLPRTNKSGFKGVFFCKHLKSNPWRAQIGVWTDGKTKLLHLGVYPTAEAASAAYELAALELHGEYRRQ